MRKTIFEVAILLHPTEDESKNGVSSMLLVRPKHILATNQHEATLLAAREIPDDYLERLDRIDVAVRPF